MYDLQLYNLYKGDIKKMRTKTIEAIFESPSFAYADDINIITILHDACDTVLEEKGIVVHLDCSEQMRITTHGVTKLYVVKSTYTPALDGEYNAWTEATIAALHKVAKWTKLRLWTISGIDHAVSLEFDYHQENGEPLIFPECKVYWAKVKENARIPSKRLEDAGYDIYPCFEEDYIVLKPHTTTMVPTGIASSIPTGYEFQIEERGSSGSKGIKYSAGVFDSGYRGEWILLATNTNSVPVYIAKDTAVIDITDNPIIYPYSKALFQAVLINTNNHITTQEITYEQLLSIPSERGAGRLGSSGK